MAPSRRVKAFTVERSTASLFLLERRASVDVAQSPVKMRLEKCIMENELASWPEYSRLCLRTVDRYLHVCVMVGRYIVIPGNASCLHQCRLACEEVAVLVAKRGKSSRRIAPQLRRVSLAV